MFPDYRQRVLQHEAAHFLVGWTPRGTGLGGAPDWDSGLGGVVVFSRQGVAVRTRRKL